MDDVPDRTEDDATGADRTAPRPESTGPATDRVRIVGAEPAGESTAVVPTVSRQPDEADADPFGQPQVRLTDEPAEADSSVPAVHPVNPGQTAVPSTGAPTELPHWTEPPTGQVPAVLSRDAGDEGSGSGIGAPTWREEDADWTAHDEEFEPAMFGDDKVALGSLDETDSTDADRRPWEFDLDSVRPGAASPSRSHDSGMGDDDEFSTVVPITEPTQVVSPVSEDEGERTAGSRPSAELPLVGDPSPVSSPLGPAAGAGAAALAGAGAAGAGAVGGMKAAGVPGDGDGDPDPFASDDPDGEELFESRKPRPTGGARAGRARRNGLLPARMRAKRPDDVDVVTDTPLAAEPPGASVTDVPGVGLKRGGVVGLAAADRSAQREGDPQGTDANDPASDWSRPVSDSVDIAATAAVAAGVPRRRPRRWSSSDRSDGGSGAGAVATVGSEPTGGGPPARRARRSTPDPAGPGTSSSDRGSSIGLRVGTGIAVAIVALLAFKAGTVASLVLCLIVVTFAAGESFGVLRRAGYHPATLLGLVGTISLMVGAYSKGVAAVPLVLVLISAFTLLWYLFGIERGSPVAGTAATLLTVGWVSLLGSYAGLLLSPSLFPDRHGIAFLLGAIIATVANDVGALVIGGGMGRHPLAPTISPNKTWEGLVGGALFSILASTVIVGDIHPWTPANAALLGVVVAVVAPIGDLCESLLKRDLRLKDMGTLLPGHGGILDRVDALLFVLPATYYLVRALNIG